MSTSVPVFHVTSQSGPVVGLPLVGRPSRSSRALREGPAASAGPTPERAIFFEYALEPAAYAERPHRPEDFTRAQKPRLVREVILVGVRDIASAQGHLVGTVDF